MDNLVPSVEFDDHGVQANFIAGCNNIAQLLFKLIKFCHAQLCQHFRGKVREITQSIRDRAQSLAAHFDFGDERIKVIRALNMALGQYDIVALGIFAKFPVQMGKQLDGIEVIWHYLHAFKGRIKALLGG